MSKIYLFCIGGTGVRVLRSVTMLAAAGVDFKHDIVPIVIDPDQANSNVSESINLLRTYNEVRKALKRTDKEKATSGFFGTSIEGVTNDYRLPFSDTESRLFSQFLNVNGMDKSNSALTQMLFSDHNLDADMTVGFKGNPNIGSVVQLQIIQSEEFKQFANSFSNGDRIFIVSSIFGGTGASGFPLLLKTLRNTDALPNHNLMKTADIGALTILPYFKVEKSAESDIDSSTFVSKTLSALEYYEKNIANNNELNHFYFLGDTDQNTYANNEGGSTQHNKAHLIEFFGATALLDFAHRIPCSQDTESTNRQTEYHELGIDGASGDGALEAVSFSNFPGSLREKLARPLTQFALMSLALGQQKALFTGDKLQANKEFPNFYGTSFFGQLQKTTQHYQAWLNEMKENQLSLKIFDFDCGNEPFNIVVDHVPSKVMSLKSNYELFMDRINTAIGKTNDRSQEERFLEMYHSGTKRLVEEKFKTL